MSRQTQAALAVAVILAAAAVAIYFLVLAGPEPVLPPADRPDTASAGRTTGAPQDPERSPEGGAARSAEGRRARFPVPPNALRPEERRVLLAALLEKLVQRAPVPANVPEGGTAPAPRSRDDAVGTLSKEYIQQQVREIIPLVKECYENALMERPGTEGKVTVRFSIIGDEELGGLVEKSDIVENEGMTPDQDLAVCVRETMYAMKFKPPEGGGRVEVTYPFIFRTSDQAPPEVPPSSGQK